MPGQYLQADAFRVEGLHQVDEIEQGAAEMVQLPHHQHIARFGMEQGFGQASPLHVRAGAFVNVDDVGPGSRQRLFLQI